jgi:hypothetical protein
LEETSEEVEGLQKYLPTDENKDHEVDHILRIFRVDEAVTINPRIRSFVSGKILLLWVFFVKDVAFILGGTSRWDFAEQ